MQNWVTSLQSAQQDVTASDLSAAGMRTDPLCSTSDCIFQCFQSGPLILMPPPSSQLLSLGLVMRVTDNNHWGAILRMLSLNETSHSMLFL